MTYRFIGPSERTHFIRLIKPFITEQMICVTEKFFFLIYYYNIAAFHLVPESTESRIEAHNAYN